MAQGAWGLFRPALLTITIIIVLISAAWAEHVSSLVERIEADLRADRAFTEDERALYLDEFRSQLAGYGRDILREERARAADVLMTLVTEGSFDQAPVERTVEVATAAYIAIRRGSDPAVVEGIALYGFRKKISADKIEAWANGYNTLLEFGVPAHVAEDLVYQAAEHGWDIYAFNTFKWGLVEAAKARYDIEAFQAHMVGTYLQGGERPGSMVSRSLRYFRSLEGAEPMLPKYEGSFIPRRHKAPPAPELDLTFKDQAAPAPGPEVPKTTEPKTEVQTEPAPMEAKPEKKKPSSALGYLLRLENSYKSYLGVPYAWGGTTRRGMDCSGFVQRVYAESGIKLPRTSREQWRVGSPVARYAIKEGDLVFFKSSGERISHVGIVTRPAEDEFIHASSSKGISYALLSWRYFDRRYAGARRVIPEGLAMGEAPSVSLAALLYLPGYADHF